MIGKNALPWKPADRAVSVMQPSTLGQTSPEPFAENPYLATAVDFTAAAASAFIAYDFQKNGSAWATFFWVVSAMAAVKMAHDLSRA